MFVKVVRYVGNNEVFLQFIFLLLLLFKGVEMKRFMSITGLALVAFVADSFC